MWRDQPIGELDLLAYADDPAGLDAQRRQAVEAHLRLHAEDAARMEVFRRQTLALRERYDPHCRAPVPERLHAALEAAGGRRRPAWLPYAAAALLAAATGAAGWLAGGGHGGPALVAFDQEKPATERPVASADPVPLQANAGQAVSVAGLLEYGAAQPDVAHLGYSLVASEPIPGAPGAVRLTYASDGERGFSLVLRSRWQDRFPGFHVKRDGAVSVVSWEEGRLAAELTARLGREEALEIAEAVRGALRSVAPAPTAGILAVGPAEAADAVEPVAPVLPQLQ